MIQTSGPDPAPEEPYLLGTDADERRRLETQHRLWPSGRTTFGTGPASGRATACSIWAAGRDSPP